MEIRFLHYMLISAASITLLSTATSAQETETIIVTADKLGSNTLQETAAAINLKTGEELEKQGSVDFIDFVPVYFCHARTIIRNRYHCICA